MNKTDVMTLDKNSVIPDVSNAWKILLEYLHAEDNELNHFGIRDADIPGESTRYWKIIDTNSDFSDLSAGISVILNNILSTTSLDLFNGNPLSYPYWNESIQRLINLVAMSFDPTLSAQYENYEMLENEAGEIVKVNGGIPIKNGTAMRIKDVKQADAGANFGTLSSIYGFSDYLGTTFKKVLKPWVIPWYNVNGHSYAAVRNGDKNLYALMHDSRLDFSREKSTSTVAKWIRLLLPQNKRKVEIEDLDRNFWVIAQTTAAISAYLFDDDGPIKKALKGLLNEIAQLWENVMYLWVQAEVEDEKPYYKDTYVEILPISNNEFQHYVKYDGFDAYDDVINTADFQSFTRERVKYLISQYTDCNLIIIPVVRIHNYESNYHAGEVYPGVFYFDRNKQNPSLEYHAFKTNSGGLVKIDLTTDSLKNSLLSLKEQQFKYETVGKMTNVGEIRKDDPERYYCLLRPDFTVQVSPKGVSLDGLTIKFYDIAYSKIYRGGTSNGDSVRTITLTPSGDSFVAQIQDNVQTKEEKLSVNISNGYYQGELVSMFAQTGSYVMMAATVPDINLVGGTSAADIRQAQADFNHDYAANITETLSNYIKYFYEQVEVDGSTYKQKEKDGQKYILMVNGQKEYSLSIDDSNNHQIIDSQNVDDYVQDYYWSRPNNPNHDYNGSPTLPPKDTFSKIVPGSSGSGSYGYIGKVKIDNADYPLTRVHKWKKEGTFSFTNGVAIRVPIDGGQVTSTKEYYNIAQAYDATADADADGNKYSASYTVSRQYGISIGHLSKNKEGELKKAPSGGVLRQTLIMRKEGAEKWTKDNWLYVVIELGFASNCSTIVNCETKNGQSALTGLAQIAYGRDIINIDGYGYDQYFFGDSGLQEAYKPPTTKELYNKGWTDADYKVKKPEHYDEYNITQQCSVSVFGPNGLFVQTIYVRQPLASAKYIGDSTSYDNIYNNDFKPGQWYELRSIKYNGKNIHTVRAGYEVVQVADGPKAANFEYYKDLFYKNPDADIEITGSKDTFLDTTVAYEDPTQKFYKVKWSKDLQGKYSVPLRDMSHKGLGLTPDENTTYVYSFARNAYGVNTEI